MHCVGRRITGLVLPQKCHNAHDWPDHTFSRAAPSCYLDAFQNRSKRGGRLAGRELRYAACHHRRSAVLARGLALEPRADLVGPLRGVRAQPRTAEVDALAAVVAEFARK